MTDNDFQQHIDAFQGDYRQIVEQVSRVIVGHADVIDQTLTCLLCGGHVLLEGVPGLGKTLLVRTLAETLELGFSRIQFTPDLMPADITGTNVLETSAQGTKEFRFQQGPVFANLVLADEINRATPKTQSAVLEAMQEQTVSVSRTTYALPQPFMVLATQNPLEMEGTYPLPEAQLDRFMLKVLLRSPVKGELSEILTRTTAEDMPAVRTAASADRLIQMRQIVRQVPIASHVTDYVSRVVLATHPTDGSPDIARKYVRYGASPRGGQAIVLAAKVRALQDGRANVAFEDIDAAAAAALRHRLILSFEGHSDGIEPDDIIKEVVAATGH
ncbi:MAG: AAA family ATPase [Planctomycetota bacterium]|jgi:MoxR-like ATPase